MSATVVSVRHVYPDAAEPLTGRAWSAPDGVAVVGERNPENGMYYVHRGDGRRVQIRPAWIAEALAASEITREPVEAIAARSAEAAADLLDDETRTALARWRA